jgi:hypothetical protein
MNLYNDLLQSLPGMTVGAEDREVTGEEAVLSLPLELYSDSVSSQLLAARDNLLSALYKFALNKVAADIRAAAYAYGLIRKSSEIVQLHQLYSQFKNIG